MKETPEQRHREKVFWNACESDHFGEPSCYLASVVGGCSGRLEAAHLVPRQRLRKHVPAEQLDEAIADERNGIVLCHRHHSQMDSKLKQFFTRKVLPPSVEKFAEEYGLGWSLGRDYGAKR